MKTILSADIGGTNSRFAYFQCDTGNGLSLIETKWLKTRNAPSFVNLLAQLSKTDFSLELGQADIAVFAIAGPVERGRYSQPPNIAWTIDLSDVREKFGLKKCELINDFVAQAYACRSPIIDSAEVILPGDLDPDASLVVIGAGTGLGHAALIPQFGGGYVAVASEGGHASFPFESEREFRYMNFVLEKMGGPYVISDVVVSGRGLSLLHEFFTGERLEPSEVAAGLNAHSEVLQWMARFYARVCRNYALLALARGGVYIAGGVAAKLPILVKHPAFETEFRRSITMAHILKKIPVFLNLNEESGLWGAAMLARQKLEATR